MAKYDLPSGAVLEIGHTPWRVSKALVDAIMEECKGLKVTASTEIDVNLIKDVVCSSVASKRIEAAIDECMKRVTLDGLKITDETFDAVEARAEYFLIRFNVAKENVMPFMKDLSAQFSGQFGKMTSILS